MDEHIKLRYKLVLQQPMRSQKLALFSLIVNLILSTIGSQPGLAQSRQSATERTNRQLQNLADGDYFYGESRSPNQPGVWYILFHKAGSRITASYFGKGRPDCFQGQASSNAITNVYWLTENNEPNATGLIGLADSKPFDISAYYRINFNRSPVSERSALRSCVEEFARVRDWRKP